jgi:hypothetical protein
VGSLKIYIPDELEESFRKRAMERFGYGKGSISKAARAAIVEWMGSGAQAGAKPSGGEDGGAGRGGGGQSQ